MKITITHNMLCRYRETPSAICKRSAPPEKCRGCKAGCNKYQMLVLDHDTCQARRMELAVGK